MSVTISVVDGQAFSDPQSGTIPADDINANSKAILQGDTLVLCFATRDSRVTVASINDSSGNEWKQVPGSYASSGDYDGGPTYGQGSMTDIWVATDVAAADAHTWRPTVTFSGPACQLGWDLYDVSGLGGVPTISANHTSTNSISGSEFSGPTLSADQAAIFIALLGTFAASDAAIASPWTLNDSEINDGLGVSSVVVSTSETETATFTGIANGTPASISAIVLIDPSGDTYDPTIPFLGTVVVDDSAPEGANDPFLGTVKVLASAPSGLSNAFLGSVRKVSVAPADASNPTIGQVVVVVSAPIGDSNPYLGNVVEA
jgi:hypothetical protein